MRSFGIAELVAASGIPVDTIRYYQSLGLLDAPRRRGRRAVYGDAHLKRLRQIRAMARRGLPLKVIKDLVRRPSQGAAGRELLQAAVEEKAGTARYSSAEFSQLLGIPRGMLDLVEGGALREALEDESGGILYSDADAAAARAALRMLDYGLPVTRLLALALKHHRAAAETVEETIGLFNEYIRSGDDGGGADPEAVAEAFRELLPIAVSLVAHHFHRMLISTALRRIKQSGDDAAFRAARNAVAQTGLRLPLQ
jgi:MerR HTH family regulatory protein